MATPQPRRTWPQRLTIAMLGAGAFGALVTAGGLAAGQWVLSDRKLVEINDPSSEATDDRGPTIVVPGATTPPGTVAQAASTTTTVPLAEPDAANFLLVGADNGDCAGIADPTVGPRDPVNARSDTIMVWRVNPETDQIAVLSFPRDLYVDLPGGSAGRINGAYERDQPQRLIDTIWLNFGVPINHFVQVDFCAFRTLVDAVGGVAVPFSHPARDPNTALNIPTAGCHTLDGNTALAYVRSRYYEWQDESGEWHTDGTSDFGRIARQQDFIRRVIAEVIGDELYQPDTISALIETNSNYVVTDRDLTPRRIIEFANVLRSVDPAAIATYRVESRGKNVNGAAMQEPLLESDNMQAILAVFRGQATLSSAPDQVVASSIPGAPTSVAPATTAPASTVPSSAPASAPLPTVVASGNNTGVAPDPNATC